MSVTLPYITGYKSLHPFEKKIQIIFIEIISDERHTIVCFKIILNLLMIRKRPYRNHKKMLYS